MMKAKKKRNVILIAVIILLAALAAPMTVNAYESMYRDFVKILIKPEPTYLGEAIPISGDGLASHD